MLKQTARFGPANGHLTDAELLACLEPKEDPAHTPAHPRLLNHLGSCSACRTEAEHTLASITVLRDSLSAYASETLPSLRARQAPSPALAGHSTRRLRWGLTFAGALTAVALAAGLSHPTAPHPTPAPASHGATQPGVATSDDALLEAVNQDLASAVPPQLEPLQVSDSTSSHK